MTIQRLGVVDSQSPQHIMRLVPFLEARGFHRYWTTEHHSPYQSGSPVIAAAVAASCSRSMLIGTAGVTLRYYRPARLGADFRLLNHLFPGRIEVGTIGGKPAEPGMEAALLASPAGTQSYDDAVLELEGYLRVMPYGHYDFDTRKLGQIPLRPIPFWVCSLRPDGGAMAGRNGLGFAYHNYFAGGHGIPGNTDAVVAYRDAFRPNGRSSEPRAIVVCHGSCATTEEDARRHWQVVAKSAHASPSVRDGTTRPGDPGHPCFLGTPDQCAEQLLSLAALYGVNEVAIQCVAASFEGLTAAYGMIASALGIAAREAPAVPVAAAVHP